MSPADYTEDTLVQQTTADYLEQQLGWESVYAYNNEDFGPDSLLGRASDREVVLTRTLREKLVSLNPGLPDAAYDDAVRQITATVASQTLVATNREKYALLRDGVQVTFRNDKGERVRQRLRVFDFDEPDNNHFLCVRELWVKGDLYRRRADIVGFVNGLPLLFIECKNLHKEPQDRLRAELLRLQGHHPAPVPPQRHRDVRQRRARRRSARSPAAGTTSTNGSVWPRRSRARWTWRRCSRACATSATFSTWSRTSSLFDDTSGEPKKIIARNHQFLGVNRAIEAVRDRKARQGKLGVFWHTQGSGKSYSMVMFTRKVHRKLGGNFTFLMLHRPRRPGHANLQDLRRLRRGGQRPGPMPGRERRAPADAAGAAQGLCVLADPEVQPEDVEPGARPTRERDDIIVITDEAHRTQYGTLALNMRNALPNASYIGFTGTPLFKDDEITRRVFGDYVSTYDFQRAVEDNATVPLYYDARGEKLGVAIGDLNERIAAETGGAGDRRHRCRAAAGAGTQTRLSHHHRRQAAGSDRAGFRRSITRRRGRPARRCWCASTRSPACGCTT